MTVRMPTITATMARLRDAGVTVPVLVGGRGVPSAGHARDGGRRLDRCRTARPVQAFLDAVGARPRPLLDRERAPGDRQQGDGARQGALRPAHRRDRAARVPHPLPAGAARRVDHVVRRRDRAPGRTRARVHHRRAPQPPEQHDHAGARGAGARGRRRGCGRSIGQGTYSVTADGSITGAAVIGYEKRSLGAPETLTAGRYPTADGEGIANESDASSGFDLGDVVTVQPGGYRIKIVGQSKDTNLQASPTIFAKYGTWEQAVHAANPDAQAPLPNALGVRPAPGSTPQQVVTRINAVDNSLEALARAATRPRRRPASRRSAGRSSSSSSSSRWSSPW